MLLLSLFASVYSMFSTADIKYRNIWPIQKVFIGGPSTFCSADTCYFPVVCWLRTSAIDLLQISHSSKAFQDIGEAAAESEETGLLVETILSCIPSLKGDLYLFLRCTQRRRQLQKEGQLMSAGQ